MVCGKRKRIVDEELLNNGYEKKYGKRCRRSESSTWSRVSKKSHHHKCVFFITKIFFLLYFFYYILGIINESYILTLSMSI